MSVSKWDMSYIAFKMLNYVNHRTWSALLELKNDVSRFIWRLNPWNTTTATARILLSKFLKIDLSFLQFYNSQHFVYVIQGSRRISNPTLRCRAALPVIIFDFTINLSSAVKLKPSPGCLHPLPLLEELGSGWLKIIYGSIIHKN